MPFITTKVKLSGGASTGSGPLSYSWDFGDGGSKNDASGATVRTKFKKAGYRKVTLTVTDGRGRSDSTTQRLLVRRAVACNAKAVKNKGSWRRVKATGAPKGDYCDKRGRGQGKDTLIYSFKGKQLDVYHGRDNTGGKAKVFIDGKRVGTVNFKNNSSKLKFRFHQKFKASSNGKHTVKLVVTRGTAYIDSFITNK